MEGRVCDRGRLWRISGGVVIISPPACAGCFRVPWGDQDIDQPHAGAKREMFKSKGANSACYLGSRIETCINRHLVRHIQLLLFVFLSSWKV